MLADISGGEERANATMSRKKLGKVELETANHLQTVWDFGVTYFICFI